MSALPPWRVYYRGGRAFDALDGSWADAPAEGVLLVVESRDGRVAFHLGADHYQLEDDGTIVCRDARTLLAAIGVVDMSPVKFGWYVSHTEMERAVARAKAEFGV